MLTYWIVTYIIFVALVIAGCIYISTSNNKARILSNLLALLLMTFVLIGFSVEVLV